MKVHNGATQRVREMKATGVSFDMMVAVLLREGLIRPEVAVSAYRMTRVGRDISIDQQIAIGARVKTRQILGTLREVVESSK